MVDCHSNVTDVISIIGRCQQLEHLKISNYVDDYYSYSIDRFNAIASSPSTTLSALIFNGFLSNITNDGNTVKGEILDSFCQNRFPLSVSGIEIKWRNNL